MSESVRSSAISDKITTVTGRPSHGIVLVLSVTALKSLPLRLRGKPGDSLTEGKRLVVIESLTLRNHGSP